MREADKVQCKMYLRKVHSKLFKSNFQLFTLLRFEQFIGNNSKPPEKHSGFC